MKTINELEQEAQQAREDLINEFSEIFNVSKESAKRLADKFILSSVAMVTYQLAQAERLHNGEVIKNPSKESYKFVVPDNSTVYLCGGGGAGGGNISTTSSVVGSSGSSGSFKGIVTIEESLPEVSQEERDSDGFIKWDGGDCPVDADAPTIVKFRDGNQSCVSHKAGSYEWRRDIVERSWDIVAYKVAK